MLKLKIIAIIIFLIATTTATINIWIPINNTNIFLSNFTDPGHDRSSLSSLHFDQQSSKFEINFTDSWYNPKRWSLKRIPNINDTVIINSSGCFLKIDGYVEVDNLHVSGNSFLYITSDNPQNATLKVKNNVTLTGQLGALIIVMNSSFYVGIDFIVNSTMGSFDATYQTIYSIGRNMIIMDNSSVYIYNSVYFFANIINNGILYIEISDEAYNTYIFNYIQRDRGTLFLSTCEKDTPTLIIEKGTLEGLLLVQNLNDDNTSEYSWTAIKSITSDVNFNFNKYECFMDCSINVTATNNSLVVKFVQ